ncbi:hypothetical protein EXIGLDRAFT_701539 [Exidia glandulosa HHB12029]|uniref:Transmembrane protein n=1 Tax=Exidia glandulosa HHB12029 TaxID=1314781 RepID=A0A165CWS7_EXIGL|nr:hypothetical protein EXIGLDRAFT_701539 [Exidia glandulosa HHB12029]
MAPRPVLLVLLALTAALGAANMALGINALAKSIDEKHRVQDFAPTGVQVNINDNDVVAVGAVLTVGCGLLGLAAFISLLLGLFKSPWPTHPRLSGGIILFFTIWILAAAIPTILIARTREADVSAFLGSVKIPDILVHAAEEAAGVSRVYWDHDYLHWASIVPFALFALGLVTTVAMLTTRTAVSTRSRARESDEKLARPVQTEHVA